MKKLLLFDQFPEVRNIRFSIQKWHLERVSSISEVLNHYFFSLPSDSPDIFLIWADTPVSEISMFLRYLKKHRPKLPFVLIMNDDQHDESWRTLLKGIEITLLKPGLVNDYFNEYNNQISINQEKK